MFNACTSNGICVRIQVSTVIVILSKTVRLNHVTREILMVGAVLQCSYPTR